MDQSTVRRRLAALRAHKGATQAQLSQALGFNDRQTLSAIELGERAISAAELVRAARFFGVAVDYFTDPFELAGEARFSWRKSTPNGDDLASFEQRAGRWIATYRHLSRLRGNSVNSSMTRVGLTARSSFEEAASEGDAVSRSLDLGDVPALTLATTLETTKDTLVLLVDTAPGISGAACQLGALNTIIINRREAEGRRSFDMGHELFHLLTWAEMPPPHVEEARNRSTHFKRVEQLADNFSSGLLLPSRAVRLYVERHLVPGERSELIEWLRMAACHFHVSGQALKWRMVGLGLVKRVDADQIADADLRFDCPADADLPPRFSRRFVETLGWGIEHGHVSVRKAAEVLDTTIDDLADLFSEHALRTPFDL